MLGIAAVTGIAVGWAGVVVRDGGVFGVLRHLIRGLIFGAVLAGILGEVGVEIVVWSWPMFASCAAGIFVGIRLTALVTHARSLSDAQST